MPILPLWALGCLYRVTFTFTVAWWFPHLQMKRVTKDFFKFGFIGFSLFWCILVFTYVYSPYALCLLLQILFVATVEIKTRDAPTVSSINSLLSLYCKLCIFWQIFPALVLLLTAWCHTSEEGKIHIYCYRNLKCHKVNIIFIFFLFCVFLAPFGWIVFIAVQFITLSHKFKQGEWNCLVKELVI
jgi:hypothetical protein